MKWAAAAALAALAAVVVVFVAGVSATRDPVPDLLRTCVTDGGGSIVLGEDDLGAQARSDIQDGAVTELSRTPVGEDVAILLRGTNYRFLVLLGRKSPAPGRNLPLQVFERAPDFALVAKEVDPIADVLRGCVRVAASA